MREKEGDRTLYDGVGNSDYSNQMDNNQHSKNKNNIVLENRYGSDWKKPDSDKEENIKKFKIDDAAKVGYDKDASSVKERFQAPKSKK